MKNPDEDYGYEMHRQEKLDEMDLAPDPRDGEWYNKTSFGGALRRSEWIQRSVRHDPRPDLPFQEEMVCVDKRVLWGCVIAAVGLLIMAGVWL